MVDKVQMPNIPSTAETTQLLPSVLAIFSQLSPSNLTVSLKAFERLGGQSWRRWRMLQLLKWRAETKSSSSEQGEEVRAVTEHSGGSPHLTCCSERSRSRDGWCCWDGQPDTVTIPGREDDLPGLVHRKVRLWPLLSAHCPPSRKEVAIPWAETQPVWALTTAETFRNVLMAKDGYTEIDDLKIEPPQHILV